MVGWHHQLDGYEFEQALGDGEGGQEKDFPGRKGMKSGKVLKC